MMRSPFLPLLAVLLGLLAFTSGCSHQAAIPGRAGFVTPLPVASPATAARLPGTAAAPGILSSPAVPAMPNSSASEIGATPGETVPVRDPNVWRAAAQPWLGTPHRLGGMSQNGIDCSGFAWVMHSEVSHRKLPRNTPEQWRASVPVNVNQLRPGDLLFYDTTGKGVSHVGVFIEGNEFVHASTSKGVIYSNTSEPYWAERFLGARRP